MISGFSWHQRFLSGSATSHDLACTVSAQLFSSVLVQKAHCYHWLLPAACIVSLRAMAHSQASSTVELRNVTRRVRAYSQPNPGTACTQLCLRARLWNIYSVLTFTLPCLIYMQIRASTVGFMGPNKSCSDPRQRRRAPPCRPATRQY